jgi:aminoglycoside phosphotransferase (APT) family kinase protein
VGLTSGRVPAADVDVDVDVVQRLLADQHPDLAGLPLHIAAQGWDNVVLRLGEDLAVRVPRRTEAAALVLEEQRVLPGLVQGLPVPIPAPVRIGTPGALHPYGWSVVPWFDGRTPLEAGVRDERLALDVAAFLHALHRPDPSPPVNPVRGVPLADRDGEVIQERLMSGPLKDFQGLAAIWSDALSAPVHAGPAVRIHGDLHPANLIVRDGALSAVVDFGDTTTGDPATDLAVAWLAFGPTGRRAFLAALAPDPATVRRARGWALVMASALVTMSEPSSPMVPLGRTALVELLSD